MEYRIWLVKRFRHCLNCVTIIGQSVFRNRLPYNFLAKIQAMTETNKQMTINNQQSTILIIAGSDSGWRCGNSG